MGQVTRLVEKDMQKIELILVASDEYPVLPKRQRLGPGLGEQQLVRVLRVGHEFCDVAPLEHLFNGAAE